MDSKVNSNYLINKDIKEHNSNKKRIVLVTIILSFVLIIGVGLLIRGYILNNPGKDININDLINSIKYNDPLNIPSIKRITKASEFELDIPASFQLESNSLDQYIFTNSEDRSNVLYLNKDLKVTNLLTLPRDTSNLTIYDSSNLIFTLTNSTISSIFNNNSYAKGIYYSDFKDITLLVEISIDKTIDNYFYNVEDKTLYYSVITDDTFEIYYLDSEFNSKKLYTSINTSDSFINLDNQYIYLKTLKSVTADNKSYLVDKDNILSCRSINIVNKVENDIDCSDIKYNSSDSLYSLELSNNSSEVVNLISNLSVFKSDSIISNLFYKDNTFTYLKYIYNLNSINTANIDAGIYSYNLGTNSETLINKSLVLGEIGEIFKVNENFLYIKKEGGFYSLYKINKHTNLNAVSYAQNSNEIINLGVGNILNIDVLSPKYIF